MDDIGNLKRAASRSWIRDIQAWIPRWRRCIWTAVALVSLFSSRYLLVELNVHFPLHLHILHLVTAGIFAAVSVFLPRPARPFCARSERPTILGWFALIVQAALMALATVFTLQALLHLQNVPTLVMLSTVSYGAEAWVLLLSGYGLRSWAEILRAGLLPFACAGILIAEYRLEVSGLLTSIPAVLLAGVARAVHTVVAASAPNAGSDSRKMNTLLCCTGLVLTVTMSVARSDESWPQFISALQMKYLPLTVVNALSTAVAMLLGKSILFPIDDAGTDPRDPQNELRNRDTLTLLTMAGVAGFISNLMLRRSYTSWAQYWCFLLAVACIGGKAAIDSLNGRRRKDDKAYKLLQESSELRSMDSEETAVSERSDDTRVADISGRRSNIVLRGLFVSAVVPFFWSAWAVLNFSDRVHQKIVRATTTLDAGYSATTPAELVISMYKEPIDDVAHLINSLKAMPHLADADVHIYIKDSESDTEAIQQRTGATNITTLPNIGREGETYLYHILQNWNTLAAHTVFLQADVHNPREFYPRIRDYFDPQRTGFLSLGWAGQVCNCEDCGDRWSWQDTTHLFPQIHSRINDNATACDKVLLSFKGQFVASAKRIRGVDTSVYQDLREAFVNKESWAHKEEYLQGRPDSMSAPVFGYTMERMWNLLFQCNDMDVAWKCPTLLSGTRGGGSIEDCQCFDPVDLASER